MSQSDWQQEVDDKVFQEVPPETCAHCLVFCNILQHRMLMSFVLVKCGRVVEAALTRADSAAA